MTWQIIEMRVDPDAEGGPMYLAMTVGTRAEEGLGRTPDEALSFLAGKLGGSAIRAVPWAGAEADVIEANARRPIDPKSAGSTK